MYAYQKFRLNSPSALIRGALIALPMFIVGVVFVLLYSFGGEAEKLVNRDLPEELVNYLLEEELRRSFVLVVSSCRSEKCNDLHTEINNRVVSINKDSFPRGRYVQARIIHFCDIGLTPVSSYDGSGTYRHKVIAQMPKTSIVRGIRLPSAIFLERGIVTGVATGKEFDAWLSAGNN